MSPAGPTKLGDSLHFQGIGNQAYEGLVYGKHPVCQGVEDQGALALGYHQEDPTDTSAHSLQLILCTEMEDHTYQWRALGGTLALPVPAQERPGFFSTVWS